MKLQKRTAEVYGPFPEISVPVVLFLYSCFNRLENRHTNPTALYCVQIAVCPHEDTDLGLLIYMRIDCVFFLNTQDSMITVVQVFEKVSHKSHTIRPRVICTSKELDKYQQFWNIADELDHMTYVLEPEMPTRASNTRRIFIGQQWFCYTVLCQFSTTARNVSVHIVIDPLHALSFPECHFLGQDSGEWLYGFVVMLMN